jgi:hypothetical protein
VKGAGQAQSTCLMSPANAHHTASSNPALSCRTTAVPFLMSIKPQITFDQITPSSTPPTLGLSTGQASQMIQRQTRTIFFFWFIMFKALEWAI